MTILSDLRAALRRLARRLGGAASRPSAVPRRPAAKAATPEQRRRKPAVSAAPPMPAAAPAAATPPRPRPKRRSSSASAEAPAPARRTVPPTNEPWSLLFLGGSNTVMSRGYVEATLACLTDRLGPAVRVENRAVGANTTIHGLMLAKAAQDLAEFDTVVIEYGVNDVKLFTPAGMGLWTGACEGLLRHILAVRPDMKVVFVQFGKRTMNPPETCRPAEGVVDLVAHYGAAHSVSMVDIDHLFRRLLFPNPRDFARLYADASHFHRGGAARTIGALVAAGIAGAPRRPGGPLPEPLHPRHFQNARILDIGGDAATADRVFANSRYTVPARRIPLGESIVVEAPGPVIAVEVIAVPEAADLRVLEAGQAPAAFHTRHALVGEKSFAFLIRCNQIEDRPWAAGMPVGPRQVTLEAAAKTPEGEIIDSYNMVAPDPKIMEAVYVTRLLCLA